MSSHSNEPPAQVEVEIIPTVSELNTVLEEKEVCPICRDKEFNNMVQTGCKHSFCLECINTHLKKSNECPICRQKLHRTSLELDTEAQAKNRWLSNAEINNQNQQSALKTLISIVSTCLIFTFQMVFIHYFFIIDWSEFIGIKLFILITFNLIWLCCTILCISGSCNYVRYHMC